jgi:hypothetical protein
MGVMSLAERVLNERLENNIESISRGGDILL